MRRFLLSLLALPALAFGQTTTVSDLTEETSPVANDQLYIEGTGGANYGRLELDTLGDYIDSYLNPIRTTESNQLGSLTAITDGYINSDELLIEDSGTLKHTDLDDLRNHFMGEWNYNSIFTITTTVFSSYGSAQYWDLLNANAVTVTLPTDTAVGVFGVLYRNAANTATVTSSDTITGPTELTQGDALYYYRPSAGNWHTWLVPDDPLRTGEAAQVSALTEKTAIVDGDHLLIEDSEASNAKKRATAENIVTDITVGTQEIWIPITDFFDRYASPAGAEQRYPASSSHVVGISRPFDASAAEWVMMNMAIPARWDDSSVLAFKPYWITSDTSTGNVQWEMWSRVNVTDDPTEETWGDNIVLLSAGTGTADDFVVGAKSSTDAPAEALVSGGILSILFGRRGSDANDTYTGNAYLLGIMLYVSTDAVNDD